MKSWLKIAFKVIAGGFGSVFLYVSWILLKDIADYVIQGIPCEDLGLVPLKLILMVFFVSSWDDWSILFFAAGALLTLLAQFRPIMEEQRKEGGKRLFRSLQIVVLILFATGVTFEVRNELAIQQTYSAFCRAAMAKNYELAYSYFSPDYRSQVGPNQFVEEIIEQSNSSYIKGCDREFVGSLYHRWNGAFLYPYAYTATACYFLLGGPELTLVRIDGKWYFTGEHRWFLD